MKLSDKLAKADDSLNVHFYDNGYMVEVLGRDSEDEWKTAKIMCTSLDEVTAIVAEAAAMERS
jgi:hypothetical protein